MSEKTTTPGTTLNEIPPELVRVFSRHIQAVKIGTGERELDLNDPDLEGGYMVWSEDEEWVWMPGDLFLSAYQEVN